MSFRSVLASVPVAFLLLFTIGCGAARGSFTSAQLRVLNASPHQQSINLLVDNNIVQTGIVSQSASAYTSVTSGSHIAQIEASGTTTPLVTQTIRLTSTSYYTILAVEPSFGSTSLTMSLLTDDNSAPTFGDFKLRIINASPDFGNGDVYITAPDEGIRGATPKVSRLAFQDASSYQTLAPGSYEVYFSVAGRQVVSVDSGELSFTAGQIRTLVLLDNVSGGFTSVLLVDLN